MYLVRLLTGTLATTMVAAFCVAAPASAVPTTVSPAATGGVKIVRDGITLEWLRTPGAGSVVLLRGSSNGLTDGRSQTLSQASAGVPSTPERDDQFGESVSVLALNGAGRMDAAIGAPGETVAGDVATFSSGTVTTMFGVGSGLGNGSSVSGSSLGVPSESYGSLAHQ